MISTPPRMVIQQSMATISLYHASAAIPLANHSDFFNTHRLFSLDCDRIRQRRPAFRRYTTQKALVLVAHQVVVCLRFLALLPSWILQAEVVLVQPRAPEFHDNVLCAGCRDCAIRLTRSADPALAR